MCTDGPWCILINPNSPGCEEIILGKSLGDYSCLVKGDYTIIEPAVWEQSFSSDFELTENMNESNVLQVSKGILPVWYGLNGTYSVYGPTYYGGT